jgi:hypothetical protein
MQELNISGCTGIDATTVANVVAKNRTLSALIFGERMGEPATLEMGMAEADFSIKSLGVGDAIIISAWITYKDKGAMTSLNLANNNLGQLVPPDGWDYQSNRSPAFKHSDGRRQNVPPDGTKPEGVIAIANAMPGMGALLSANLLKNNIPVEQAQELVKIMQSHKTLTTLCGLSGKETELNMSCKMRGAGDAVMLAPEIIDNGALSKIIFGGDRYHNGDKWVIPEPATLKLGMAEADLSNKNLGAGGAIIVSTWITHKDNGAMTSLNLASNNLRAEGAKIVA